MLKIMRGHKVFSVFLISAITIMISVAFIFWGIGPKDNPEVQFVAKVDGDRIMLDEYYRAYDNQYKRLKEQYSEEEIEKMNMPERVINSLIDRKVLLMTADRAGISVSEKELQDQIVNYPAFQRNGVFDVNVYENKLRLNRLSPKIYEDALMSDLIVDKISKLIGETAELSAEESKMLESIEGGNKEQLAQIFLKSKSGQAIQAYIESIKRELDITIKREMIL
jgi:peptidyl-prolyl cis-trans isomerase D